MSIGTIVTIVLLMTVLILGIFLVQKIFGSARGAIDMTDAQLEDALKKLFTEESKVAIFPNSRFLGIKHEEREAIGIGIRNLARTGSGSNTFSYSVTHTGGNCPTSVNPMQWIIVGESQSGINLVVGDLYSTKVLFEIPLGTPLCVARFTVNTQIDGATYKPDFFDIAVEG